LDLGVVVAFDLGVFFVLPLWSEGVGEAAGECDGLEFGERSLAFCRDLLALDEEAVFERLLAFLFVMLLLLFALFLWLVVELVLLDCVIDSSSSASLICLS